MKIDAEIYLGILEKMKSIVSKSEKIELSDREMYVQDLFHRAKVNPDSLFHSLGAFEKELCESIQETEFQMGIGRSEFRKVAAGFSAYLFCIGGVWLLEKIPNFATVGKDTLNPDSATAIFAPVIHTRELINKAVSGSIIFDGAYLLIALMVIFTFIFIDQKRQTGRFIRSLKNNWLVVLIVALLLSSVIAPD